MTRRSSFTQNEVVRAVKGAKAAGLDIAKVIAGKHGIEIITVQGAKQNANESNSWDRVLGDETD